MRYQRKYSFITTTAVAMGLLLSAATTQAATVTTVDGNVTKIENLEVVNQLEEVTIYNVDFVTALGSDIYGTNYDFDFTQEEDAVLARNAVNEALNIDNQSSGAGPDGTSQYQIGLEFDDTSGLDLIAGIGGEYIGSVWSPCDVECGPLGTSILSADVMYTYADFSPPVPVPAAAWLFGSALLGLAGVARKR